MMADIASEQWPTSGWNRWPTSSEYTGKTTDTELTAFTDGCSGLRSILVNAGVKAPPYLDWFHIAMRLQHAEKTASTLPIGTPERENARAMIVAEVGRLHWRIWNGKAKDARITLKRIRQVMPVFRGDGDRKRDPSSRRLWTALREIDRYLTSQSALYGDFGVKPVIAVNLLQFGCAIGWVAGSRARPVGATAPSGAARP